MEVECFIENVVDVEKNGDMVIVSLAEELSARRKTLLISQGGNSRPILFLRHMRELDGFYVAAEASGNTITCEKFGKNRYVTENYDVHVVDNRVQLRKKTTSSTNKIDNTKGQFMLLPPLMFRSRTSIFNIDKIDTIAQSFQADFYAELRLICVIDTDDIDAIECLLENYNISRSMVDFMNISEIIGEKSQWERFALQKNSYYTFVMMIRMKAIINEQMEVETFPFDVQPMTIGLTFNAAISRVRLEDNKFFPSIFFSKQFQSSSVYDVVYDDVVLIELVDSDPSESSAGWVYPRMYFYTYFARRPSFYLTNVAMPMTLLTLLGPLSNAIEPDGEMMGTADRLGVSLTLLLTAVAYKFIVASSLPQVSYLTSLDTQVLLCFAFLVVSAVENVVFPWLYARQNIDRRYESHYVVAYFSLFVLLHVALFAKLGVWLLRRHRYFAKDLIARKVVRDTFVELTKMEKTTDIKIAEDIVDRVLRARELDRPLSISHPFHRAALGESQRIGSAKVNVEDMAPLVDRREIEKFLSTHDSDRVDVNVQ